MTNDKLRELADALSHQQQADMDGVLCTVSRQAVDEAIAFLRECAAAPTPPAQADVRAADLRTVVSLLEGMADAPSFADRLKAECKRIGNARVEKWAKLDCEDMVEQAKADAVTGYSMLQWIKLTDRMPNPDEHGRVLIFTEGYDFNGEQVFDVRAETLNECFYADPDDQPEVCRVASHWMPHPTEWRPCECESQYDD